MKKSYREGAIEGPVEGVEKIIKKVFKMGCNQQGATQPTQ